MTAILMVVCASLSVQQAGHASPEHDAAIFREWASSLLPTHGTWTATITPQEPNRFTRWYLGYDWATGSFFMATAAGASGQDASGAHWYTPDPSFHNDPIPLETGTLSAVELLSCFPSVLLRDLVERDQELMSVTPGTDGGYIVVVPPARPGEIAGGIARTAGPDGITLDFDARGRLRTRHTTANGHEFRIEYTYDERCPGEFAIPSHIEHFGTSLALDSCESHQFSADLFDRFRVRGLAVRARQAVADSIAAAAGNLNATMLPIADSETTLSAPPTGSPGGGTRPHAAAPWTRYRWPLVTTGLVVIAIAVTAWWKRRQ